MFRFDKLTQKAQEAFQQAQQIAEKNEHQAIHPLHLLIALAAERDGIVRPVLEKCGVQPDALVAGSREAADVDSEGVGRADRHLPVAFPQPGHGKGLRGGHAFQRRICFDRAFAAGPFAAEERSGRQPAGPLRRRARRDPESAGRGAGHAAHYRSESGIEVSGAGALRGRSDRHRRARASSIR